MRAFGQGVLLASLACWVIAAGICAGISVNNAVKLRRLQTVKQDKLACGNEQCDCQNCLCVYTPQGCQCRQAIGVQTKRIARKRGFEVCGLRGQGGYVFAEDGWYVVVNRQQWERIRVGGVYTSSRWYEPPNEHLRDPGDIGPCRPIHPHRKIGSE